MRMDDPFNPKMLQICLPILISMSASEERDLRQHTVRKYEVHESPKICNRIDLSIIDGTHFDQTHTLIQYGLLLRQYQSPFCLIHLDKLPSTIVVAYQNGNDQDTDM